MRKSPSGLVLITVATVVGGIAGYVITWLVPRQIGFASYATFAIFWSFLFLIVSALSGIQQEVTRAAQVAQPTDAQESRARNFGLAVAMVVLAVMLATAPLWLGEAFPAHGWSLVWPLAVGSSSYVLVTVLYGSLYGIAQWMSLFWLIAVDALMRLAAVAMVLFFTVDLVALSWAVVLPFPLTIAILWLYVRPRVRGKVRLDVGYRQLSWNASRTVVAAASMGALVSGFPLILGLTSRGESMEMLGLLILAVTLVRAPLIVVAMSFQSYLIVLFRNNAGSFWKIFAMLYGAILTVGLAFALAGWWLGPGIFGVLFPGEMVPGGWLIAVLVLSSALVGAMFVSAAAVLSRARHAVYTAGWVVAAVVTVICLLTPLDMVSRTILSLIAGPLAGLLVHGGYLAMSARVQSSRSGVPTA